MMFNVTKIALVAALGMFISLIAMQAVASDRSIRCGTYLIYAGGGKDSASMYEVLKKCGEPEAKNGNNWIYIQGSMLRILTFNYESRLENIESERK
jgi:hypothetical protein